jgi:phage shock protein B
MRPDILIPMMALAIPLSVVIGVFLLIALAILKGGGSKKENKQMRSDEARTIQEIHRGLTRMEERIDALETLLLDRAGSRKQRKGEEQ